MDAYLADELFDVGSDPERHIEVRFLLVGWPLLLLAISRSWLSRAELRSDLHTSCRSRSVALLICDWPLEYLSFDFGKVELGSRVV